MDAQADTTLIAATNRRTDLDSALLSRFDVRIHFAAPEAPGRCEIFGLYAKHLPTEQRFRLGDAARGLSGRDILDVCRQAERRWMCSLLRDELDDFTMGTRLSRAASISTSSAPPSRASVSADWTRCVTAAPS